MFLKRIEIYGFKSFAGRSVLDFDYSKNNNITAVVGPNGSGKSNVADAIRWVTGEQSTKNLRSKKSEDVIFCGSTAKPKSSYAEVSLLLSSDSPVTFELAGKQHELTEIEISRKLYRSGESEYLINHKKVRLTDIQQLLASLGFGQSSYTVIGQGMVDRLLFFTASERKVLFDEAAGVKQYEIKREQAMRKLESTDSNLIRLKDILTELEPRVVNLRRLVKRAEGRKEFEVQLLETQQKYFGSLMHEYQGILSKTESQKAELNKKVIQFDKTLLELEQRSASVSENPFTSSRQAAEDIITRISRERDSLLQAVAYLRGQVESVDRGNTQAEANKKILQEEKATLVSKIDFLEGKIVEEDKHLSELLHAKEIAEAEVTEIRSELDLLDITIQKPATQDNSRLDGLKKSLSEHLEAKYRSDERLSRLEQERQTLVSLVGQSETLATQRAEAEKKISDLTGEIDELSIADKRVTTKIDKLTAELRALSSVVSPDSLAAFDADVKSLELAREDLLSSSEKDAKDFRSKFQNFITNLNKLFVQFRYISKAASSTEKEKLDNQVDAARKEQSEIAGQLVTLQIALGAATNALSLLTGDIDKNIAEILRTKSEIKGLETEKSTSADDEIAKLESEIKKYEGSVAERTNVLLREKDSLQDQIVIARDRYHQAEMEYTRNKSVISNQQVELDGARKRLTEVDSALESILNVAKGGVSSEIKDSLHEKEKQLNKLEEDLAKQRGGLTQIIASEREHEQRSVTSMRERRALEEQKAAVVSELTSLELEEAKTGVRLEDLKDEMRLGEVTLVEGANYGYLDQMEKDVLRLKMENLRRKLSTTVGVDPETEAEYVELEARATEMANQVNDLTQAKSDLEKVVTELDERIRKQFADVFKHISSEFSRYFSMLFGGGSANLKLGEDEEGNFGIEITANPPGKRVQSLNALSGGERTLTSLALLFAILSVNPSPFCVLDEVDAALDESNTLRFIKILGDLAKKTQFIIISHNRDTMKVASSLYGVTMNDEHVSKLLSVKLTEALVAAK